MDRRLRALALIPPAMLLAACGLGASSSEGDARADQTSGAPASSPGPSAAGRSVVLRDDGDLELQQDGERVSVTCVGPGDIDIEANGVVVTTKGTCGAVSVDGRSNVVTLQGVVQLEVDGTANRIKAASASEVDVDGSTNAVTVGTIARELHVQGSSHNIRYGGKPRTDFHQDKTTSISNEDPDESDPTGDDGVDENENEPDEPGGTDP